MRSVAMGGGNLASGTNSAAVGVNNQATGDRSFAAGNDSVASGNDSLALGNAATAGFSNSAAIGNGAAATRANQQVFGTDTNTYTMSGITSSASKAAQGKPTHLVTSNSAGDLAAFTVSQLGIATTSDISSLQSKINRLGDRDRELTEGIATVASLAQPILLPGQHFAVRAGWGGYDGASAVGFSAAGVVANNLLRQGSGTVTLDGGVGIGTDEGEVAGRAGATFGW